MKISSALFAGALAIGAATGAQATLSLVPDTGWQPFSFGSVGATFSDDFQFTIATTETFRITDVYLDGDQFAVSVNGGAFQPTSTPVSDGTQVGANYTAAYYSPKYSHLTLVLGPGTYDITGEVLQSPYAGGGAGVALGVVPTPEPAAWVLMLLGVGAAGAVLRRRPMARGV